MSSVHEEATATQASARTGVGGYLFLTVALVLYVALCTGARDNLWEADAWEHERAVRALVEDLREPGNPTYATNEPSIRYSPYTLVLALVARATGASASDVLSAAAVANTALLLLGLWLLTREFGERRAASAVLLCVLALYGGTPAYAGSNALADLPWLQVNPSAFALALALPTLVAYKRLIERRCSGAWVLAVIGSVALILLTHGMTAVLCGVAFLALAVTATPIRPARSLVALALICIGSVCLGLLWPYYDLRFALTEQPDNAFWFNPAIEKTMLSRWCFPAFLCGVVALREWENQLVRLGLLVGYACYGLGLVSLATHSPTFARLPLAGLVLLHVAIGTHLHHLGLGDWREWPARLRQLRSPDLPRRSALILDVLLVVALAYCGLPQLAAVARRPHLARPWIAPLVGAQDRQLNLRSRLERVLAPVGAREVVLSDLVTSWPVPSVAGRIVAALHLEFFVRDQEQRIADVAAFFSLDPAVDRAAILTRHSVRWILLCKSNIGLRSFDLLHEESAVVHSDDLFVLMDASRWLQARVD